MDDGLEFDPFDLFRRLECRLGLTQVPRKAIEYISAATTCSDNSLLQHLEYQLIGNKIAALEKLGGCVPDFCTSLDFLAQEFSAGQMRDSVVVGQLFGLSSLASSRGRDQEHSH